MWSFLAHTILRYRILLMVILVLATIFMGYQSRNIKWSYSLANIIPENHAEMIHFKKFKTLFGEDDNIFAIGLQDSSLYEHETFRQFDVLISSLQKVEGVTNVLGLSNLQKLEKEIHNQSFNLKPVFENNTYNQSTLDSLLKQVSSLKFYTSQILNEKNGATIILVTIKKGVVNTKERNEVVEKLIEHCQVFEANSNIDLHYSGLPYVRSIITNKVKDELLTFLALSIIVTGIILFLFFRSFKAVFFPLIVIAVVVVCVLGTLSLLQYEITLLTGLIPPIIVVIGIPNSIYMINKYHREYQSHGNQMKAISQLIRAIGIVTFITNLTTAIGFFVLTTTNIHVLVEFGLVAGINIMVTFVVSIILIPSVFSLYNPPTKRHLKHLKFKFLEQGIQVIDLFVHRYRPVIFILTISAIIISCAGLSRIKSVAYMVDDVPENSEIKKDLKFFEKNFKGVMPLEIIVDTQMKKGIRNLRNLRKIDQFQQFLGDQPHLSNPISVINFIKAARQAFYNNNEAYYSLPTRNEQPFIIKYLEGTDYHESSHLFVDTSEQILRISVNVADIGSIKLDSLVNKSIVPTLDSLFMDTKLQAKLTGTTLIFIKGNKFLIENLMTSMTIAFVIIALIMASLFRNVKMIFISVLPNIIPLLITAGIMGFFEIPLKSSTALIFSIAFGIAVDDSIHFLAKYRQELFARAFNVSEAVSISIRETGTSMIYTSIVLFFGFIIFTLSEFEGTVALGLLTSITLFFAMLTNTVVLPALILQFDSGKRNKKSNQLIESVPELAESMNKENN